MTVLGKLESYKAIIDGKLSGYFNDDLPQKELFDAMRYSLLSGGKRIRGVLVLAFAELCGGSIDDALPFACAVEMLHTYSLIHDDLPCMDDDELRRGVATNHIVYGECTATLAGDALQAAAFETMLSSQVDADKKVRAAYELAFAAGEKGICGGQYLDMLGETEKFNISQVKTVHSMKTAAMIKAACKMGAIVGGGSASQIKAAEEYAGAVGLAFQIRDDILDVTSTVEELGKPIGSDRERGKSTFVSLLGIEECELIIRIQTSAAISALKSEFSSAEFLIMLAEYLAERKS